MSVDALISTVQQHYQSPYVMPILATACTGFVFRDVIQNQIAPTAYRHAPKWVQKKIKWLLPSLFKKPTIKELRDDAAMKLQQADMQEQIKYLDKEIDQLEKMKDATQKGIAKLDKNSPDFIEMRKLARDLPRVNTPTPEKIERCRKMLTSLKGPIDKPFPAWPENGWAFLKGTNGIADENLRNRLMAEFNVQPRKQAVR